MKPALETDGRIAWPGAAADLLHQVLEETARALPNKEAVVHGEERRAYAWLDANANRVANALIAAGIRPGDRVGLLMPNCVPYICSYFGTLKAGAVAVPIDNAITAEGLRYVLEDAGATGLVVHPRIKAARSDFFPKEGGLRALFSDGDPSSLTLPDTDPSPAVRTLEEIFRDAPADAPAPDVTPDALACLLYTSGSTGRPKGVMLTHANIVANTRAIIQSLGLDRNDRMMVVLPFFYCYGASLLHTHFAVGATVILENQFLYPNKVLERMEEEGATGFAGVPSTFAMLLRRSDIRARSLDTLRYVTQAGGAMAPVFIRELRETLPRTDVFIMYGQTEASARLSCLAPDLLPEKIGSVGMGIPGVELRVLRDTGEPVDPGETGEIVAKGPNIMQGYWNSPEETRQVLDRAGLHTGDLGRVDEDGFVYIVGRKKDMIKSGAHRVSAKEIEDFLLEEPSVLECAVIGVEDEMMGEGIKAFIVPVKREGMDVEAILRFCKQHLPPYKVPRHVEIRRSLPKNEAGKIVKGLL